MITLIYWGFSNRGHTYVHMNYTITTKSYPLGGIHMNYTVTKLNFLDIKIKKSSRYKIDFFFCQLPSFVKGTYDLITTLNKFLKEYVCETPRLIS